MQCIAPVSHEPWASLQLLSVTRLFEYLCCGLTFFSASLLQFGLGGGIGACNNVTGTDGNDLGLFPYLGISSSEYSKSTDPFKQSAAAQAYLRKYYNAALEVRQLSLSQFLL